MGTLRTTLAGIANIDESLQIIRTRLLATIDQEAITYTLSSEGTDKLVRLQQIKEIVEKVL